MAKPVKLGEVEGRSRRAMVKLVKLGEVERCGRRAMAKLVMLGEVEWCSGQVQRANNGEVDGTWAKLKT